MYILWVLQSSSYISRTSDMVMFHVISRNLGFLAYKLELARHTAQSVWVLGGGGRGYRNEWRPWLSCIHSCWDSPEIDVSLRHCSPSASHISLPTVHKKCFLSFLRVTFLRYHFLLGLTRKRQPGVPTFRSCAPSCQMYQFCKETGQHIAPGLAVHLGSV